MDIREVAIQLLDGLDNGDIGYVIEQLKQIQDEDGLTIDQLNDLCWQDSNAIFDRIY
jgi:hypothetical protein